MDSQPFSDQSGPDKDGFYTVTYSDLDISRGFILYKHPAGRIVRLPLSKKARAGQQFCYTHHE